MTLGNFVVNLLDLSYKNTIVFGYNGQFFVKDGVGGMKLLRGVEDFGSYVVSLVPIVSTRQYTYTNW